MDSRKLGQIGEEIAQNYLKKHHYSILTTHWQKRSGEIDIIAFDNTSKETVFVEVKTTSSLEFGFPEEKVNTTKIRKILKTALFYINEHQNVKRWRIDVISILINTSSKKAHIKHYKNISFD